MRPALQTVDVRSGFGSGVIGADAEVFAGGPPVYLLETWREPRAADPARLRAVPSRMLDARAAVVRFRGREAELAALRLWRAAPQRLAARWVHGPGGAGKTRLAAQFAAESAAAGWKVVDAIHGAGTIHTPGQSHDLRPGSAAGLLVLVDYADRWPYRHLRHLLGNTLLNELGRPTRVLFLGRRADLVPALRETADEAEWLTSEPLPPLPAEGGDRAEMFRAARDSFAARYGVAVPATVVPPPDLHRPEMGLTLSVHMVALVAVDAHVHRRAVPAGPAGLSIYLLDREHEYWRIVHSERPEVAPDGRVFGTDPEVMNRAVHTAALCGPVARAEATDLLRRTGTPGDPARTLADHAFCYPPEPGEAALQPLSPDRLAEDFLALTMAGHDAAYPHQGWAAGSTIAVLGPRAVVVLTAAAGRWPHLGRRFLSPLLRRRPALLVTAGSAAMINLATAAEPDLRVLAAVEAALPEARDVDLDAGIAAISVVLTRDRLARTTDPGARAALLLAHARRLTDAGRHREALRAARRAALFSEQLTRAGGEASHADALLVLSACLVTQGHLEKALSAADLAARLDRERPDRLAAARNLAGSILARLGRHGEALRRAREAVRLWRASADPAVLAGGLTNLSARQWAAGLIPAASRTAREAVSVRRLDPADRAGLATALTNSGVMLATSGRRQAALGPLREAGDLLERLVQVNPGAFRPVRAAVLNNLSVVLAQLGRHDEALPPGREAADAWRELADENPAAHLRDLVAPLDNLGFVLSALGAADEALAVATEATEIVRRLAAAEPATFEADLGISLTDLSIRLHEAGRAADAVEPALEAVRRHRRAAGAEPTAHRAELARSLHNLAVMRSSVEDPRARASIEEAITRRRQLVAADRGAHLADLAASLTVLGSLPSPDAVPALREAVALLDELIRGGHPEHRPGLASALIDLAAALSEADQDAEAVRVAYRAADLAGELARSGLAGDRAAHADALNNLGHLLSQEGRKRDAEAAAGEAVAIYRDLDRRHPGLYAEDLAAVCATAAEVRERG